MAINRLEPPSSLNSSLTDEWVREHTSFLLKSTPVDVSASTEAFVSQEEVRTEAFTVSIVENPAPVLIFFFFLFYFYFLYYCFIVNVMLNSVKCWYC